MKASRMPTDEELKELGTGTLLEQYLKFREVFNRLGVPPHAGETQRGVMLDTFDAGAQILLKIVMRVPEDIPDEEGSKQLEELNNHFDQAAERIRAERQAKFEAKLKETLNQMLGKGGGIEIMTLKDVSEGKLDDLLKK